MRNREKRCAGLIRAGNAIRARASASFWIPVPQKADVCADRKEQFNNRLSETPCVSTPDEFLPERLTFSNAGRPLRSCRSDETVKPGSPRDATGLGPCVLAYRSCAVHSQSDDS